LSPHFNILSILILLSLAYDLNKSILLLSQSTLCIILYKFESITVSTINASISFHSNHLKILIIDVLEASLFFVFLIALAYHSNQPSHHFCNHFIKSVFVNTRSSNVLYDIFLSKSLYVFNNLFLTLSNSLYQSLIVVNHQEYI